MTLDNSEKSLLLGIELFQQELYWDAIEQFKSLLATGESDLLDDISLNLGITYMKLGLLDEAEPFFDSVFNKRVGDDEFRGNDQIKGRPSDRAALGLFRIANAKGDTSRATELLNELATRPDAGIDIDGEFTSFYTIAKTEHES